MLLSILEDEVCVIMNIDKHDYLNIIKRNNINNIFWVLSQVLSPIGWINVIFMLSTLKSYM